MHPNLYFAAKALHLIGMVSWMAGLFYLVRLMVNHAEALDRPEPERGILTGQFGLMEWKVYRVIIQPALVITFVFGVVMLVLQPEWLRQPWMHVKLLLVVFLAGYTHYCRGHIRRLEREQGYFPHVGYRALNEVPTLFLAAIVFLAVYKAGINFIYLTLGIVLFGALIFSAVRRLAAKKGKISPGGE